MRVFIALDIPGELREFCGAYWQALAKALGPSARQSFRPVPQTNYHLTLQFLGEVHQSTCGLVSEALATVAQLSQPFGLRSSCWGGFPSPRRARVLWLGFEDCNQGGAGVVSLVHAAMSDLGFLPEQRSWVPHVTLARLRRKFRPPDCAVQLERLAFPEQQFVIRGLLLVQSRLGPNGARYTALTKCALGDSG